MRTLLTCMIAAMALTASSAHATDGVVRIHVGDLDLSRSADVEIARHRMQLAIREYCSAPSVYPIGYAGRCKHDLAGKAEIQLAAAQALTTTRLAAR